MHAYACAHITRIPYYIQFSYFNEWIVDGLMDGPMDICILHVSMNGLPTDHWTDQWMSVRTNGRMDGRTDTPFYWDARTHQKVIFSYEEWCESVSVCVTTTRRCTPEYLFFNWWTNEKSWLCSVDMREQPNIWYVLLFLQTREDAFFELLRITQGYPDLPRLALERVTKTFSNLFHIIFKKRAMDRQTRQTDRRTHPPIEMRERI